MTQSKKRTANEKAQVQTSPGKLGFVVAGGFVLVVLLGLMISMLAGTGETATEPILTQDVEPSPISALLDSTTPLADDPTATVVPFSPPTDAMTPTPAWDQLFAGLPTPTDGWSLLVLHTNDSWGYLYPCG